MDILGTALRRVAPLAVVGGLLALVAAVASMSTPGIHSIPDKTPAAEPIPQASHSSAAASPSAVRSAKPSDNTFTVPSWVQEVITLIGAAIVLILVAYLVWRVITNTIETRKARASRRTAPITLARREAVLAAVDASIAELARDDGDPRSAVIVCWVRLEEVAAAAGVPRAPADTPADLVRRLLDAHDVSGHVLDALADIYRAARYSPGEVAPSMRDDARLAFLRLRDELSGSYARSAPDPADPLQAIPTSGPRHQLRPPTQSHREAGQS